MRLVADTNIFLAVALDEPEKEHIIQATAGADIVSPEILPYELGNALSAMVMTHIFCNAQRRRVVRCSH